MDSSYKANTIHYFLYIRELGSNCSPQIKRMMKQHIFVLLLAGFGLMACQADEPKEDGQKAEATAQATSNEPSETEGLTRIDPPRRPGQNKKAEKPEVGQRTPYQPPKTGRTLTLAFPDKTTEPGAEVCLTLRAKGFENLLSNQYTVRWDPKVLQFKKLKDFVLPGLGLQNFGQNRVAEGIMPSVWIDNTLSGVTLPADTELYTVCFEAVGKPGQRSEVTLSEKPTPFEVVDLEEKLLDLKPVAGTVTIQ